jgi:hypothetical protein
MPNIGRMLMARTIHRSAVEGTPGSPQIYRHGPASARIEALVPEIRQLIRRTPRNRPGDKAVRMQGFLRMELAGLEPATSWVR